MIENATYHTEHAAVYPGEYEALPWKEKELRDEINRTGCCIMKPPVNISEMADYYKVEMAVPGFKAEDLFIHTNERQLSIAAFNKKPAGEHYLIHNFHCECIQRNITLPADTDTDFVTAEYRNGILTMLFFKTSVPSSNRSGRIIVY